LGLSKKLFILLQTLFLSFLFAWETAEFKVLSGDRHTTLGGKHHFTSTQKIDTWQTLNIQSNPKKKQKQ
jgi:hypothetical protein